MVPQEVGRQVNSEVGESLADKSGQPGGRDSRARCHNLGLRTNGEMHLVDGPAQPGGFDGLCDGVGDVLRVSRIPSDSVVPVLMWSVIAVCT
jgi:hypothetical protein